MALPPLSRPRRPRWLSWLRWVPHVVIALLALSSVLGNLDQLSQRYDLGVFGIVAAVLEGVALLCAMRRPVPAFWLSLAANVASAQLAAPHLSTSVSMGGEPWPWAPPGMTLHAMVLLLLALRVPTGAAVGAAVLSCLVGPVLQRLDGAAAYDPTSTVSAIVFAFVTVIGVSARGRRVARTQLVEEKELTAHERERRTLLEERSRIARELHDVVAHHMSVISIQAQVAPHLVKDPPEELKENLAGIRQNALEALTELRRVLGVLRSENPDDPDDPGAPEAAPQAPLPTLARLDALVENARAAGLTVSCETSGEALPLPPGVDLSAYRIVQEALSNAIRHAPGSTVRVELAHARAGLRVRVTNTATTAPAGPSPGAGHGLLGMRERTTMLGGDLATGPTPDGGYEVAAFLPTDGGPQR
ncbi:sensor histidine kinase [Streptomyces sp. NPDC059009]|uniref:sensor histidine kinase n=1 Tax=Streptomyces sp. NPDC059009 TaxID=3346694 RepID=UPI00367DC1D8